MPEVLENEKQGFLIELNDIDGFAEAGIEILKNDKLWEEMSRNGIKRARDFFDSSILVPQYENYYRKVLD